MSIPLSQLRKCFCLRQLSLILRLRRLRLTARLNSFLGTDTSILGHPHPVPVRNVNLIPGTLPCLPWARSVDMPFLPQSLSVLGSVQGLPFSTISVICEVCLKSLGHRRRLRCRCGNLNFKSGIFHGFHY